MDGVTSSGLVYKVLWQADDGALLPATYVALNRYNPAFLLEYPRSMDWATADTGGIFAFQTLKAAMAYVCQCDVLRLAGKKVKTFLCEAEDLYEVLGVARWPWQYEAFWDGREVPTEPAPAGTLVVDRLRLIRTVAVGQKVIGAH